jgi:acyl-coenzyme A thioesterase PaaI-like protein
MTFYDNGDDVVESRYTVPELFQGYPGIVHGGVQASILDEIAGRISLVEDMHAFMMSVRLDVKYRHPVPTEEPLHIVARREYLSDRYGQAHCMIYLADGKIASDASVKLVRLPEEAQISGYSDHVLGWRIDP